MDRISSVGCNGSSSIVVETCSAWRVCLRSLLDQVQRAALAPDKMDSGSDLERSREGSDVVNDDDDDDDDGLFDQEELRFLDFLVNFLIR